MGAKNSGGGGGILRGKPGAGGFMRQIGDEKIGDEAAISGSGGGGGGADPADPANPGGGNGGGGAEALNPAGEDGDDAAFFTN